jgi:hypothetical protein
MQTYVYKDLEVHVAVYILESLQNTTKMLFRTTCNEIEERTTYLPHYIFPCAHIVFSFYKSKCGPER